MGSLLHRLELDFIINNQLSVGSLDSCYNALLDVILALQNAQMTAENGERSHDRAPKSLIFNVRSTRAQNRRTCVPRNFPFIFNEI